MDRIVSLTLDDEKSLYNLGCCLTSNLRRKILIEIGKNHSYTIMELAEKFNVPLSTMSTNIKIMYDAGLILLTKNPKKHGNEKIVSLATSWINIKLAKYENFNNGQKTIEIPIGSYTSYEVQKPCGLADENSILFEDDKPEVFMSPNRINAQIMWFNSGYVEYTVPTYLFENNTITSLSFSLELCSECPNYRNDWQSAITFSINGIQISQYVSPGDFGGRQGLQTPSYWSKTATQFGLLKTILVDDTGTLIDGVKASDVTISDLKLQTANAIRLRIEVKKNSKMCGGINIFGKKFGDHPQDIILIATFTK